MSALTTPFIHTSNTIDAVATPVNAEQVVSIDKVSIDANSAIGSRATYDIVFNVNGGSSLTSKITWRYETENLRDTDYDDVLATVSTEIAPAS